MARPVTLTTTLNTYGGDGAYLALYVTDASGAYVGSLWMAGGKSKYYEHLSDWYRATAVEDMRDSPNDVAVPLTTDGAGTPVTGRRYVASFAYDM